MIYSFNVCIQDTLSLRALGRVRARAKVSCIQFQCSSVLNENHSTLELTDFSKKAPAVGITLKQVILNANSESSYKLRRVKTLP